MALDLPEFDRPANATSRPTSSGNWSTPATDSRNRTLGKLHGRPSVQFAAFQGARKTMIESRFSVSALPPPSFLPGLRRRPCAFAAGARRQGLGRSRRHQGRRVHRLPRRRMATAPIRNGRISRARMPPTSASSSRCSRPRSATTRSWRPSSSRSPSRISPTSPHIFAAQTPAGLEADPSYWKAGEALYKSGDAARNIPACTACHGPAGQGNAGSGYPALRAQHSVYTVKQLQDYLTQNRYRDAADRGHRQHDAQQRHDDHDRRAAHAGRHPQPRVVPAGTALATRRAA